MTTRRPAGESAVAASSEPPDLELRQLVQSAVDGNAAATRQLLELVAPRIRTVVRTVFGRAHADVEDVVQQSLIGFVQALPSFRMECDARHFAMRIAVRTAVAARRRVVAIAAQTSDGVDVDAIPTHSHLPSRSALAQRRTDLLRELLAKLPEEQSEVLALRVVLGWTLDEVAKATSTPSNTVRSRLRLAKEAMRRRILADSVLRDALEVDP